jgi:hypothetical protein
MIEIFGMRETAPRRDERERAADGPDIPIGRVPTRCRKHGEHGPLPTASYPDRSTTYATAAQSPLSRTSALISGR